MMSIQFVACFHVFLLVTTATTIPAQHCQVKPEPKVILKGEELTVNENQFSKHYSTYPPSLQKKSNGVHLDLEYYVLNKEKNILYVPNFSNASIAEEIKTFCVEGQRFTESRIRGSGDASGVEKNDLRTSESCPLVPAASYLSNPRWQAMTEQEPMQPQVAKIAREVDVSWFIATRASDLLQVDANTVEALQVVRYTTPNAEYKLHHDHGGYYGKHSEHRSWTMLIFLNDVVDAGGHTAFPKLDLEVVPRGGDALVWSNLVQDGTEVDEDMVHMGQPPSKSGVEKYAVNVWFGVDSFGNRVKEGQEWT
mmetsp:Transcript_6313/g.9715  ORF Transcript_6313/g.9715 Transcript_6313/m.9715 type:complete len:308 (+) Transcript_6313:33-956(+)